MSSVQRQAMVATDPSDFHKLRMPLLGSSGLFWASIWEMVAAYGKTNGLSWALMVKVQVKENCGPDSD